MNTSYANDGTPSGKGYRHAADVSLLKLALRGHRHRKDECTSRNKRFRRKPTRRSGGGSVEVLPPRRAVGAKRSDWILERDHVIAIVCQMRTRFSCVALGPSTSDFYSRETWQPPSDALSLSDWSWGLIGPDGTTKLSSRYQLRSCTPSTKGELDTYSNSL